jgi:hypothetical protein
MLGLNAAFGVVGSLGGRHTPALLGTELARRPTLDQIPSIDEVSRGTCRIDHTAALMMGTMSPK